MKRICALKKKSFSVKAVKYTLRIALYALHERRICSTVNGQLHVPQYGLFSRFRRNTRAK